MYGWEANVNTSSDCFPSSLQSQRRPLLLVCLLHNTGGEVSPIDFAGLMFESVFLKIFSMQLNLVRSLFSSVEHCNQLDPAFSLWTGWNIYEAKRKHSLLVPILQGHTQLKISIQQDIRNTVELHCCVSFYPQVKLLQNEMNEITWKIRNMYL